MKWLCFSDIHNQLSQLEKIYSHCSSDINGILACGDWTTFGSCEEVAKLLDLFKTRPRLPFLAVAGNCDSRDIQALLEEKKISLDGNGKIINNIGFFGLSACNVTPLFTPFERTEEEIKILLELGFSKIKEAPKKILLSHVPPYNTKTDALWSGRNGGSKTLRTFLEKHPIDLVLCGHIHEARGINTIGSTVIANVGAAAIGYYAIVDIGEKIEISLEKI